MQLAGMRDPGWVNFETWALHEEEGGQLVQEALLDPGSHGVSAG